MKNPTDVLIGQRVRQRRWMLKMTQHQLADQIGIRFQQIQKYESGTNRISAARLWSIASALSVPVAFFYGSTDDVRDESDFEPIDTVGDPMDNKETFELLRAYYRMAEEPRRRVLALVQAWSAPAGAPSHATAVEVASQG